MLVQLLVGGVAAVAVAAKLYWRRVLTLLRIRKPRQDAPAEPDRCVAARADQRPQSAPGRLVPRPRQPRVRSRRRRLPRAQRDGAGGLARRSRRRPLWAELQAEGRVVATEPAELDDAAGPARRGRRGRAAPRARAVRLLPVRVAVLDAQGRRAAAARPQPARAARGPDAQGRLAVQRAVPRHGARVHRRRLVRAAAPGRAVGRLPAVLHALPLSADAAGLQGPALPRRCCAARWTASRRATRARCSRPPATGSASGVLVQRGHARAHGGPLRGRLRARRQAARCSGPASTRSCSTRRWPSSRRSCAGLEWSAGETAWTGYGEDNTLRRRRRRRARRQFVREAAGAAARRRWPGTSAATTAPTRASPPSRPTSSSRSTPTTRRSTRSTGACATSAARTSCRSSCRVTDPSPDLGWRGLRAGLARAARDAGPRPLLAVVHHLCITGNVPVREFLDWLRSLDAAAGDRVPRPRRPDGAAAAERQARRREPRLRARRPSSARSPSASTSSAARPVVGHAHALRGAPAGVSDRGARAAIGFWRAALHLGGLWALAFAQPLLDLLGRNAEFFVARGQHARRHPRCSRSATRSCRRWPARRSCGRSGGSGRRSAGAALLGARRAARRRARCCRRSATRSAGSALALAVAPRLGALAAALYARAAPARTFLTVLSPAPLVVLVLFLVVSPVQRAAPARATPPAPWPVPRAPRRRSCRSCSTSCRRRRSTTRAAGSTPSCSRTSRASPRDATWYRRATTVDDLTTEAVPAQLTGEQPQRRQPADDARSTRAACSRCSPQPRADRGRADHRPVPGAAVRRARGRTPEIGSTRSSPTWRSSSSTCCCPRTCATGPAARSTACGRASTSGPATGRAARRRRAQARRARPARRDDTAAGFARAIDGARAPARGARRSSSSTPRCPTARGATCPTAASTRCARRRTSGLATPGLDRRRSGRSTRTSAATCCRSQYVDRLVGELLDALRAERPVRRRGDRRRRPTTASRSGPASRGAR